MKADEPTFLINANIMEYTPSGRKNDVRATIKGWFSVKQSAVAGTISPVITQIASAEGVSKILLTEENILLAEYFIFFQNASFRPIENAIEFLPNPISALTLTSFLNSHLYPIPNDGRSFFAVISLNL